MSEDKSKITQLGDFRLTKKLGEGGMGTVYKAHQISMDRDVALKILPKHLAKDTGYVERFYREARASAKLDHPNIVRGIAVGEDRGYHYFAMEYIDGESSDKVLGSQDKLRVGDAVKIALDVARALDHAHSKGLVHRDIKPDNIMITRQGSVKLADLGLAKATDEDKGLTQTGSGFGTPYYMPPEQARNAKYVDNRSDIYALGATLYHLLTGKVPFDGETVIEVLTAKEEGKHTPARRHNPEVTEILDLVIDKMTAKDPKARYQTSVELIAALEKTGLANESLSWLGGGSSRTAVWPAAASTRNSAPASQNAGTVPASDPAQPSVAQYYLRYKDRAGKLVKATGDKHQIRDLIRKGLLGTEAEAAKDVKGPYRPLLAFPEFNDIMKARVLKERGDLAVGGGMANKFAEIDKQVTRRGKMRKLKATMGRLITGAIVLGIVAGAAYFAWTSYQAAQARAKAANSTTAPGSKTHSLGAASK